MEFIAIGNYFQACPDSPLSLYSPDLSKGAKFLACHVIIENRNISIMKLFILNSFIFLYPIRKALIP